MSRQVESQAPAYLRQVDRALVALSGIRYSAVQDDVERILGNQRVEAARAARVEPEAFAASVASHVGLAAVADRADAAEYNRRLVAIAAFAAENREWTYGAGVAQRPYEDGVAILAPATSEDGKWGFSAGHAPGASVPAGVDPDVSVTAIDIGDALARLDVALEARSAPSIGR